MRVVPAYIPLDLHVREKIKKQKGNLTYSQFFSELLEGHE